MISIVINGDTRPGNDAEVCEHEHKCLGGVRSFDFLTDGVRNKRKFFEGHDLEVILYIDEHLPLPAHVQAELSKMVSAGEIQKIVCKPHDRTHRRWNDLLYLEALKLANGNLLAHFDGDCAAFAHADSLIVTEMVRWLASGYEFVCQPTTLTLAEHGMTWASTRFFMCRNKTLHRNAPAIERACHDERFRNTLGHSPCFEHVLGNLIGGVHYPPADWNDYMIFSWVRYYRGLYAKLTTMPYEQVRDYVLDCGIHGPNDVLAKPI